MKLLIASGLLPLVLAGCSSPGGTSADREPYVKPGLILLTADQAERRGITIARGTPSPSGRDLEPLDAEAVAVSPGIKVYSLNRAIDPADPELMHEAHVVYRRESTPQWRLDAPAAQKILVGPQVTDGRQDLRPLLTKELAGFMADERRVREANNEAVAALFRAVDALRQQQEATRRALVQTAPTRPGPEAEPDRNSDDTSVERTE